MKKTSSKKNNKGRKAGGINPREDVIIYRGPLSLPQGLQERQKITTVLHTAPASYSSNGGGTVSAVVPDDPSGAVDWTHLANAWDEYRVLGFTFHFIPFNKYNRSTTEQIGPIFHIIDRDDATALTTEAQAVEYESLKADYLGKAFTREVVCLTSVEDSTFITTATPVARNWLKLVAQNITPSLGNVGRIWVDYLVQFRGRN